MKKTILLLTVFAITLLSNCTKESDPDIRNEITGNYSFQVEVFKLTGSTLEEMNITESGTITAEKNNAGGLDFIIDNIIEFQAENITKTSNGFTFDILPQMTESGTITGYKMFEAAKAYFHGAQIERTIWAAMQTNMNGQTLIFVYEIVK